MGYQLATGVVHEPRSAHVCQQHPGRWSHTITPLPLGLWSAFPRLCDLVYFTTTHPLPAWEYHPATPATPSASISADTPHRPPSASLMLPCSEAAICVLLPQRSSSHHLLTDGQMDTTHCGP